MIKFLYRKKRIVIFMASILLYVLLRCKWYEMSHTVIIPNVKPMELWEYLSDFTNMKKITYPTIIDFVIESESGSYKNWKYRVHYREHLPQIPFMTSLTSADYHVMEEHDGIFAIYSNHKSCFVSYFFCVNTNSVFRIKPANANNIGSEYTEFINYECPVIFSSFCRKEVQYQRIKIGNNLMKVFKTFNKNYLTPF